MQRARWLSGWVALLLLVVSMGAVAQTPPPVITLTNVARLAEVDRLGRGVLRDAVYSPGGLQLIVATSIGLWLHDANDMTAPPRHVRLTFTPTAIDIRPDGTVLAIGDEQGNIHLIDMQFGTERTVLRAHSTFVTDLAFSPDGLRLASSAFERAVILWDTVDELPAIRLAPQTEVVSLAFSPDGQTLATGGLDSTIQFWDSATGEARSTLLGHSSAVMKLAFSPDGQSLASTGTDNTIRIWDVNTGVERNVIVAHLDWVTALAYSPDGRVLYTGSEDGTARAWDTQTAQQRFEVRNLPFGPASLVVRRDGRALVVVSPGDALRVINTADGTNANVLTEYTSQFTDVAVGTTADYILTSEISGLVRRWEARAEVNQRSIAGEGLYALGINAGSGRYVTGDELGRVRLWATADGASVGRFAGHDSGVRALAYAPDGLTVATASLDGPLYVWDVASEELRGEIAHEMVIVNALDFSPGGASLLVGGRGGRVRLLDTRTGILVVELTGLTRDVVSVAFSPDGTRIAAASSDSLIVWQAATGRQIASIPAGDGETRTIAFNADSRLLAVGIVRTDGTGAIHIINSITGEQVADLRGHTAGISALAFSADGTTLVSASLDGSLSLWQVR